MDAMTELRRLVGEALYARQRAHEPTRKAWRRTKAVADFASANAGELPGADAILDAIVADLRGSEDLALEAFRATHKGDLHGTAALIAAPARKPRGKTP